MERQLGGTGGRAAPGSGTDDRQLEREEGEARVTREEEGKKPKWKRGRPTTIRPSWQIKDPLCQPQLIRDSDTKYSDAASSPPRPQL